MHVAFFDFVTHYGGAPRGTVELAERLNSRTRVSVIDSYGYCDEYRQAITRAELEYHILDPNADNVVLGSQGVSLQRGYRVLRSLRGLIKIQSRLVRLVRRMKVTVVYSSSYKGLFVMGSSLRLRKLPLVGFVRRWPLPETVPTYSRWLYRKRCSALFAVSEPTKAALRCLGTAPEKITVLHNPIDGDAWLARAEKPLETELPQPDRPVRLLLPATPLRTKGQHTAVRALKAIVERRVDAVLWLAGDLGVGGDQSYVSWTKQLATDLGVSDRVEWLGARSDLPQVMKASTMVVLPTHMEGLPRVLLEAMVLGKPVAATPVGGNLDLILPGVTGQLFEVEDADGLADCIAWVADHPEQAERMAQRAKEYVRTSPRFSPERHTERALEVFRKLSGGA